MTADTKKKRYERIEAQLAELFRKTTNPVARMSTAAAILHAKVPGLLWTGWYLLEREDLVVGPYQGPLACLVLARHTGVCWASIDRKETVIVPDVHAFPGHIACDSRSRSEIVIPLRDNSGDVVGVLDVDSAKPAHFDTVDGGMLERIVAMIYG